MNNKIEEHLNNYDFDIRMHWDARFMDQKVTPDVLCIIADCVLEFISNDNSIVFTARDIWDFEYTDENVVDIFRKPSVNNDRADNEYDKFFSQPLRMLAYSWVLELIKRWNRNFYKLNNKEILEYISLKERNALKFIQKYLMEVIEDSWLDTLFNDFFENQDKTTFNRLKVWFIRFIIANTPINKELEPKRIFTKILNPLAFLLNKKWTKRWFLSKTEIQYDELMYNRANSKNKWETREEYENRAKEEIARRRWRYTNYSINKAKRLIFELYKPNSEMKDEFAVWNATDVHHIFMKSDFPELADFYENLILLTWTQHYSKAHPNRNTQIVDEEYQILLLIAKLNNVKESIIKEEWVYSIDDFIYVLNTWFNSSLPNTSSFQDIWFFLNEKYQQL